MLKTITSPKNRRFRTLFLVFFSLILNVTVFAQKQNIITGVVTSETNETLPGATVALKGAKGTITDLYGRYKIQAKTGDILTFRFVGYLEQSVTVGDQTTLDIKLQP
jgi:hypothetical protein